MKISEPPRENIEGLQILRAVAALMVVFHHARLSIPGGQAWPSFGETGVDIFFVISGFVMAYTTASVPTAGAAGLAARRAQAGTARTRLREVGAFLEKRLLRIVPLYALALLWVSRRELAQGRFGIDLLKDFLFIPHLNVQYPYWLAPTVQQGWTLNFEMFFYLLFAVSLLLGGAWRLRFLIGTLAALAVAGVVRLHGDWPAAEEVLRWSGAPDDTWGIFRRFYTDNILLEFGYGVLLQRLLARAGRPAWPRWAFALMAAAGIGGLALLHSHWPRGVTQGLPAALVVWAGIHACAGLRSRTLELLGAASYAIYLFHWASFGAVKPLAHWLGASDGHPGRIALLMGAHVLVATGVGVAIHLAIEQPFLRWARARLRLRRAVASPALPG